MFRWAVFFLVVALVAGLLGFGGIAGTATEVVSTLFWVFVLLFAIAWVLSLVTGRRVGRVPSH